MKIAWMVLRLLGCSAASPAATIMIKSTSEDTVGQAIVYNLRNEIARSALHRVVYTPEEAGFVINVVTIKENDGRSTAYSAVLLMPPMDGKGLDNFITSVVGFCGASVAPKCAADILATFDDDIAEVATAFTKALKQ